MLIENGEQVVTGTINVLVRHLCARERKWNVEKVQWYAKSVKFFGV